MQNGHHYADSIFNCIVSYENDYSVFTEMYSQGSDQ